MSDNQISSKKIANATKWSFVTEITTKMISPLINIVLARLLVPAEFGAVASINMVVSFAEVFTDAGFQKYIVQHNFGNDKERDDSVNVAFTSNLLLAAIIVGMICTFRNDIARVIGSPSLGSGIAVSSLNLLLISFTSIQMALYRRNLDFRTLFSIRFVTSIIPVFVTIPLAFFLKNYWALVIGSVAVKIAQVIVLVIKSKYKVKIYFSLRIFKDMFAFTSWTLLESISIWLTSNVDIFIVGRYLDNYYLGLYKTSMTTVNSYMGIISGAVTPVLFSSLSRFQNDPINFEKTYSKFQILISMFILPMGVGMFLFSDLVTVVLLGSNWIEASQFIGMWGLVSSFSVVICYFASEVFRSKGKPNISLVYQLLHISTLVPVVLWAAPQGFSILTVSRCLVVVEFVVSALIIVHFLFGIKFAQVIRNIYPSLISSACMGVIGSIIRKMNTGLLWDCLSIGICIVVYFIVLFLFPSIRNEIRKSKIGEKYLRKIHDGKS